MVKAISVKDTNAHNVFGRKDVDKIFYVFIHCWQFPCKVSTEIDIAGVRSAGRKSIQRKKGKWL